MEDYRFKTISESAGFLYEHKIPTHFLMQLINSSFDAKIFLSRKLDLIEKNNYRVNVPLPSESSDYNTKYIEFVKDVCSCRNRLEDGQGKWYAPIDSLFYQDNKKNKFKITKMSRELWEFVLSSRRPGTQVMLKEAGLWDDNINCIDKFMTQVPTFNIWYGDQIKGKRILIITANPLDLLRASHNSSFQSCYRPNGEQFNGVISNMLSDGVLMATIEDINNPGYKVGRLWVYANETFVLPGRSYGSFTDDHRLYLRNYIQNKLGGDWVYHSDWHIGDRFIELNGPSYLDNGYGNTSVNKLIPNIKKVVIPPAICLLCGTQHNNCACGGVCKICNDGLKAGTIKLSDFE
jgi:hypothetical protein